MGYRIEITTESGLSFYGSKHYGYSFELGYKLGDKECLKYPSYRYLKYLGKVDGREVWDYGCNNPIDLTARQFNHFIKLYSDELQKVREKLYPELKLMSLLDEPNIKLLMKSKESKHLEWN